MSTRLPIHSTGGAVPIKNEKGQVTMQKVRVARYIAGKRPAFAGGASSESEDDGGDVRGRDDDYEYLRQSEDEDDDDEQKAGSPVALNDGDEEAVKKAFAHSQFQRKSSTAATDEIDDAAKESTLATPAAINDPRLERLRKSRYTEVEMQDEPGALVEAGDFHRLTPAERLALRRRNMAQSSEDEGDDDVEEKAVKSDSDEDSDAARDKKREALRAAAKAREEAAARAAQRRKHGRKEVASDSDASSVETGDSDDDENAERRGSEGESMESSEEESDEYDDDDDDLKRFKPVFIPKSHRFGVVKNDNHSSSNHQHTSSSHTNNVVGGSDDVVRGIGAGGTLTGHETAEQRKQLARKIVGDVLKVERSLEAAAAQEAQEAQFYRLEDVDTDIGDECDSDGNVVETAIREERAWNAWKVRELTRIKRERGKRQAVLEEQARLDMIHSMTEEERKHWLAANPRQVTNAKDKSNAQKWHFLQKYYHRGVFYLDKDEEVLKRDTAPATLEDKFDKSVLPKVMQVKNFGKAGRTKWTHLVAEDTSLAAGYGTVGGVSGASFGGATEQQQNTGTSSFSGDISVDIVRTSFYNQKGGGMKQQFSKPTKKT